MYVWPNPDWPAFTWDHSRLSRLHGQVLREQGRLHGQMELLGFELRSEAHLRALTEEVVQSGEIEGEIFDSDQVRSSIARQLGMDIGGLVRSDRNVDGMVEMMLDATANHATPLTMERLFAWHSALFPAGRSGMRRITVGSWRTDTDGPMQVLSGPVGRERVHFEAPPASRLAQEMARFLDWFAAPGDTDPVLVAGLAHFWFVTIHPFDDGNGRIARAITEMALARSEMSGQRYYSVSAQIRHERKHYYDELERSQEGELDITHWQLWFLNCVLSAIDDAQEALGSVLAKARFWERFAKDPLNTRQISVLNRLLDGLEGKLTTSKWAKLAKCSQDTAYRDILDLIERGALEKDPAGGRSTSYSLVNASRDIG
jgi:Fic family protein